MGGRGEGGKVGVGLGSPLLFYLDRRVCVTKAWISLFTEVTSQLRIKHLSRQQQKTGLKHQKTGLKHLTGLRGICFSAILSNCQICFPKVPRGRRGWRGDTVT